MYRVKKDTVLKVSLVNFAKKNAKKCDSPLAKYDDVKALELVFWIRMVKLFESFKEEKLLKTTVVERLNEWRSNSANADIADKTLNHFFKICKVLYTIRRLI